MKASELLHQVLHTTPDARADYAETRGFLSAESALSGSVMRERTGELNELVSCFRELGMVDTDAVAFCRRFVTGRLFWIEWFIFTEGGATPAETHSKRRR